MQVAQPLTGRSCLSAFVVQAAWRTARDEHKKLARSAEEPGNTLGTTVTP
jgi:hypothetical protein